MEYVRAAQLDLPKVILGIKILKRNVLHEIGVRVARAAAAIVCLAALTSPVWAGQVDIIGPAGSGAFGTSVTVLPNGNIVVTDPDAGVSKTGAVYLYGPDGSQISRLTGSSPGDRVGLAGIVVLTNGNFVIRSPDWSNGDARNVGAATWVDGRYGLSGVVSVRNSLVGTVVREAVGLGFWLDAVVALSNGNYVVPSPHWNNGVSDPSKGSFGAVTWGNGTSGVAGVISSSNSLVGTTPGDYVGARVIALSNGNYVVASPYWNNGVVDGGFGAVTWGNGATGSRGAVSTSNSLVGTAVGDQIGVDDSASGINALSNGNYVVVSTGWNNFAGAVTWGNGTSGTVGRISSGNSLVGTTSGDVIGADGVTALSNGNYVIASHYWNDRYGEKYVGAVTWGNGASGITGTISPNNSLIGTNQGGLFYPPRSSNIVITPLSNGNYVVTSRYWKSSVESSSVGDFGAATWANGTKGLAGLISSSNSLVGTTSLVAVTALSNGNYVVASGIGAVALGFGACIHSVPSVPENLIDAATWGNGATGTTGRVSSSNSLLGASGSVTALSNGNYVMNSPCWSEGVPGGASGALTLVNGASSTTGTISASGSLVGVGGTLDAATVTALSNGNYVVGNMWWGVAGSRFGAVTWRSGASASAATETISASNSLIGTVAGDTFGSGGVDALSDGHYVITTRTSGASHPGGVTLVDGRFGASGTFPSSDTVVGGKNHSYDPARRQLAVGRPQDNIVTLLQLSLQIPGHSRRPLPPLLLHLHERIAQ